MPTPTSFGSKRRTAPHNGRSNAAKRAAAAAKKKRNYAIFLEAMKYVTPYRKIVERNQAFNNTVNNAKSNMNYNNIMHERQTRRRPLGLTQQQWYALAGALLTVHRYPNVHLLPILQPISTRVRATGRYTKANRNAFISWAKSI